MTREEHLNKIVSKCRELLAIAEKRTPGEWKQGKDRSVSHMIYGQIGRLAESIGGEVNRTNANSAFIASCAGPAEAGWKATIAAIEGLLRISASEVSADPYEACNHPSEADEILDTIISAWSEELL